jgi:dihydroxy-acid dehydratase
LKQVGYRREDFTGKPVIGIINTWSEINPCHYHLRERAEFVKRGGWQAGGFPVEIPAMPIAEIYLKPSPRSTTTRSPWNFCVACRFDGAVLMRGCDKTTPGLPFVCK